MLPSTAVSLAQTKPYRNSLQVWTFLTRMQVTFFPELPLRLPGSSFQHGLSRAFGSFSTQQRPMAASLSTPATTLPASVTLRPAWTRPKLWPTGPVPLSVRGPAASASAGDLAPAPECPGVGAPSPAPRAPLHMLPHDRWGAGNPQALMAPTVPSQVSVLAAFPEHVTAPCHLRKGGFTGASQRPPSVLLGAGKRTLCHQSHCLSAWATLRKP